jgi:hypothetical protein
VSKKNAELSPIHLVLMLIYVALLFVVGMILTADVFQQ